MATIKLDLTKQQGKIKPMHAVGQPPFAGGFRKFNFTPMKHLQNANIPYSRLHDVGGDFGGNRFVDIGNIFRDFNADENDPASYSFAFTDHLLEAMADYDLRPIFRLGETIENQMTVEAIRINPPKDFAKWARICEHIIRHYNEGWANGYRYGIEYWEIWNEPDTGYKQGNSPTWGGTMDEFFVFFETALYYLKEKVPHLKIGGPSMCSVTDSRDIMEDMFNYLNRDGRHAPLDFFSWHLYGEDVTEFDRKIKLVREFLDSYGYEDCESILNEWNYVKGWVGEELRYSQRMNRGIKGASFVAGAMCVGQSESLDMLMYYDARPTPGWNGLFEMGTYKPYKSYFVYPIFRDLLHLGTQVPAPYMDDKIYTCCATDGENYGMMLTYFDPEDDAEDRMLCLDFKKPEGTYKVEYYLLDERLDYELVREEIFSDDTFKVYLKLQNFSVYDIKITKM